MVLEWAQTVLKSVCCGAHVRATWKMSAACCHGRWSPVCTTRISPAINAIVRIITLELVTQFDLENVRWGADPGVGVHSEALPTRMSGLSMDHPQYEEQLAALDYGGVDDPPPQQ